MQAAFLESWLHEPAGRSHRVLGRRLRPFCAWHRLLLEAVDSPLVRGAVPTLADLETAVRVCRSGYRTPLGHILPAPPRRWLARRWRQLRVAWIAARYPLPAALTLFGRYVGDYYAPPEVWQESAGGAAETQNGLPDMLAVVAQLMAHGVPEAAAWEMPLGRAQWYGVAFARQAGADIRLRTESDTLLNAIDLLKARVAAKVAARNQDKNP